MTPAPSPTTVRGPRAASQSLPPDVQEQLDRIKRILEGPTVDVAELEAQLTALAKSIAIERVGERGAVRPGRRARLALVPNPAALPPIPVNGARISIEPRIRWFFEENSKPLARDRDWAAPDVAAPSISVLLKPKVVEAPRGPKDARAIRPRAKLTLTMPVPPSESAATSNAVVEQILAKSEEILLSPVGDLPVLVEPVEVPTVLALFRHKHFSPRRSGLAGFVLLVFDPAPAGALSEALTKAAENLPLDAAKELTGAFDGLPAALAPVPALGGDTVLGFLAKQIVDHKPNVRFATGPRIRRLAALGIPDGDGESPLVLDAGNAVSSLIFLGVGPDLKGRTVRCWSGELGNKRDPFFALLTRRAGFVLIEDLHADVPDTVPAAAENVHFQLGKKPGAANTFGDALSAIEFL